MNEERVKQLVEQSLVTTTPEFVDQVMDGLLEETLTESHGLQWDYNKTLLLIAGIALMVSFVVLEMLDVMDLANNAGHPFFIVSLLLLFYAVNHVIHLTQTYKKLIAHP